MSVLIVLLLLRLIDDGDGGGGGGGTGTGIVPRAFFMIPKSFFDFTFESGSH